MSNILKLSRRTKIVAAGLSLAAGTFLAGSPVQATPATLGFYPATDIYGKGNVHLDSDTYGKGLRADAAVSGGLTYGIGPDRDGLLGRSEIGFDYLLSSGGTSPQNFSGHPSVGDRLLYNVKTQLFNSDDSGVRLVVGGWGIGDTKIFAPNIGYITGSKTFGFGRVHAGVAHSFSSGGSISGADGRYNRDSISLGYDRYITPKLQFAMDYYTGKSAYAGVQPTLYYYINDKANFGLGYFRTNNSHVVNATGDNIRNQIYVCFDYNFDLGNALKSGAPAPDPVPGPASVPETVPGAPASN